MKRNLRIGLLWHSINSSNLGLGALTASNINIIRDQLRLFNAQAEFVIIAWPDPNEDYIIDECIQFIPFSSEFLRRMRGGLYQHARELDFVIDISGGDSFTDVYGYKRFIFQASSKLVVLMASTRLILAPQTIGPFQNFFTKAIARLVMRRCAIVFTRDPLSTTFIESLDEKIKLIEATDVAFALPYEKPAEMSGAIDQNLRVGLNVSGLLFHGGYSRKNQFTLRVDYRHLIEKILEHFLRVPNVSIHLISHVIVSKRFEAVEDDFRTAEKIAERFPDTILEPAIMSPTETKALISEMDFFIGSRMHACIAAFSTGVPTVPLAYTRKFRGLFESFNYYHVADCQTETEAEIFSKVVDGFDRRETLKREILSAQDLVEERLERYRVVLRDEIKKLCADS